MIPTGISKSYVLSCKGTTSKLMHPASSVSRKLSYDSHPDLKTELRSVIPERVEQFKYVKSNLASKSLGEITVGSCIGGMRGNKSMLWQATTLDPNDGVKFHGRTIKECQRDLKKAKSEADSQLSSMLPEAMFWYLLTGKIPSQQQVDSLSLSMAENGELPEYLKKIIDSFPKTLHPMTQLSMAVSALNNDSYFASAYARGISKDECWEYVFDDVLNLIAKLPAIAGRIYSNCYHDDILSSKGLEVLGSLNKSKDLSYNFASMLGMTVEDSVNFRNLSKVESSDFVNLVRLYCALHSDHEGGNVSAHATHLVGSALGDPYISYASGLHGLAGPLHGLAAQEVLRFIVSMKQNLVRGEEMPSDREIEDHLWKILNSGRVIPGYGHAVLRKPDPRFEAMMEFGLSRPSISQSDIYFKLVDKLSSIAPGVLSKHGKTKNPFPNVDSASGVLFYHYGLTETLYFTVIFGVSRALGPLSQLIWDRIYGLPIERPKSITLQGIMQQFN